jgi:hypothetical protein
LKVECCSGQTNFLLGGSMKKLGVATVGLVVLVSLSMAAQDMAKPDVQKTSQARHVKTIRISGKVSQDGTRLVEETSQKSWLVSNLETLKGYEGQQVALRGRIGPETNTIQVLSIRGLGTYTANSSDSAFRR